MLGAGLLTFAALDTIGGVGFAVGDIAPLMLKYHLLCHLFVGFVLQQLCIVGLHVVCDGDVLRAQVIHAIATAGAQRVHVFRDVLFYAVDVGLGKGPAVLGHPTGHINMVFGGKADQGYGNLGAAYAEPNGRLSRRLIA